VRRKRPESVQVLNSPTSLLFDSHESKSSAEASSPFSNFQRTLATFQPKLDALQPKLDKARFKTEAGLSRRGYVRGSSFKYERSEDREGLVGGDSVFGDDHAIDESDDERQTRSRLQDRQDNLKWPVEEGWRPL
jgi:hypothetical protein